VWFLLDVMYLDIKRQWWAGPSAHGVRVGRMASITAPDASLRGDAIHGE
jgi:hypothetical protein